MPGASLVSHASQPMPIPARSARAQRANRRETGPSGPSSHARDATRKSKPTETETTNTRTLADYYSVPEPWRQGEPRCILRPCPTPEQHTLGAVAFVADHVDRVNRVNHELELADVGGARISQVSQVNQVNQVNQVDQGGHVNPWQAFGNTLYEAWLKGPCES